jgi:hypothetical protein
LWTSGGKNYVITTDGLNQNCCLDMETGKVMWTVKRGYYLNTVVIQGDNIVIEGQVYKMSPAGVEKLASFVEDPSMEYWNQVIFQDHLYQHIGGTEGHASKIGGFCCFDMKTGQVSWKGPKSPINDDVGFGHPIVADGKLIMTWCDSHGRTTPIRGDDFIELMKASPEGCVQLGLFNPKYLCPFTSPALAGGKLFLRLRDGIVCYDLRAKQ